VLTAGISAPLTASTRAQAYTLYSVAPARAEGSASARTAPPVRVGVGAAKGTGAKEGPGTVTQAWRMLLVVLRYVCLLMI
jgi:hypothetical protein